MSSSVDVLVVGGGINGAGVARDAAGRGLSVLLAERGDYAGGTSSASSKLIHGGLRYLETLQFGMVREALREREVMLRIAPHITKPLRFLLPISREPLRPEWTVRLGLWLYDVLAGNQQIGRGGRLSADEVARIPHLRGGRCRSVLYYPDVFADDSRLVMETLLDARARGAEIRNYCEVLSARPVSDGYLVTLDEEGTRRDVLARYLVNAAGPWTGRVEARIQRESTKRRLLLVRGSHIVISMPRPAFTDAFTLQQADGRVVFVLPWLERFLIIGTTEVPQDDPDTQPACTDAERDYLLAAVTEAFDLAPDADSVVWSWSGVRPLADDKTGAVGRASRRAALHVGRSGRGGSVTICGGKITTYRRLGERVMDALAGLGASIGPSWTADAPLHGGTLSRSALSELALGASLVPYRIARRWVFTYGEATRDLVRRIEEDPALGEEVVPGVPLVELEHAWSVEDARTGEDFMERRTKLRLFLPEQDRKLVVRWFADRANGLSQFRNTSVCPRTVSSF